MLIDVNDFYVVIVFLSVVLLSSILFAVRFFHNRTVRENLWEIAKLNKAGRGPSPTVLINKNGEIIPNTKTNFQSSTPFTNVTEVQASDGDAIYVPPLTDYTSRIAPRGGFAFETEELISDAETDFQPSISFSDVAEVQESDGDTIYVPPLTDYTSRIAPRSWFILEDMPLPEVSPTVRIRRNKP